MESVKAVVFACGTEEYAVPVEQAISIEKLEQITPIPHLPNYLLGFTRNRGELIPVLDFERILYNRSSNAATARIIVLNTDVVNYGLLVTEAREILDLDESILKQMGLVNYSKTRYFTAVANLENRMITYVDPKILVNSLDGIREIINYLHKMLENEKENVEA
ncbi:chemotaxis protein CheW [Lysinibacillus sphaericus]|uniref:CheW protein n=2 Tax=Lysinibacillus TaxID=400634 RepID=A0A2S0JZL1_LYSSH|nr:MULTISPECIES: CheW domain-containing protein [Lysinibacillus]AHN22327.1 chemotaxis protein CheW [Lysinibacillus varians]AVK96434.1 chemotaxis protein CheW [Lysinibacillus sphaericus]MCS1381421.1 chemotaxis protein CheW [Lysinibacillus sphaericus]MED4545486.1 CheW domain-containing protein [Lysinibacillus sphaericus]TKI19677.1 chemotaxis protein CheW [Lysinibacillus sphaericus]